MNKKSQLIEIFPYQMLKNIQENFCSAFGVSLAIYDASGNIIIKEVDMNKFWKNYVFENPLVYPKCNAREINAIKACINQKSLYIYPLYCGISAFAVPIIINNEIIAVCVGGKVRTENPNLKLCKTEAENIKADFDSFFEDYLAIPFINNEKLISIANLLKQIIETLINLSLSQKASKEKIEEMEMVKDVLQKEIYSKTKDIYEVHKKYELIIENAIDIILTIDKEGIITDINKAAEEEFNNSRENIIGNHFLTFIEDENIDQAKELLKQFIDKKINQVKSIQLKIRDSKNNIHYFSVSAKAAYDSFGELSSIQCIMHNITEQKQLENELRANEYQYANLFESIKYGIYLSDAKGNIIKANKSFYELFKYTEGELKSIKIWDLFAYDEKAKNDIEKTAEEKQSIVLNTIATDKNKKEFYAEFSITVIKNNKGEIMGYSGIIRDISNRIEYISKAKEEETKYKMLFDNLQEGIIITNEKGEIIEYNKKICHIFKKNIETTTNIKDLVNEITEAVIEKLKKKGQIDINSAEKMLSITGIMVKIHDKTQFQWIFKEIYAINYSREKQSSIKQLTDIPIEKNA